MIIKTLKELKNGWNNKNFNSELENMKKQREVKNTTTDIKSTLEKNNSWRLDDTQEGIS